MIKHLHLGLGVGGYDSLDACVIFREHLDRRFEIVVVYCYGLCIKRCDVKQSIHLSLGALEALFDKLVPSDYCLRCFWNPC